MNHTTMNPWIAVAATLLLAVVPCKAEPVEIRVRLHVYVRTSPSTLAEAKETASFALLQAGVRPSWVQCPTQDSEPTPDPSCLQPLTPLDLQLRILDRVMAKRVRRGSESMGFALVAGEFSSIAAAYFHRAVELEAGNLASRGAILGGILAHEIGHLLGVTRHSERGLMRAVWQDQDLKALAKGRLWFTEEQAVRIAEAVAKRDAISCRPAGTRAANSHRETCESAPPANLAAASPR